MQKNNQQLLDVKDCRDVIVEHWRRLVGASANSMLADYERQELLEDIKYLEQRLGMLSC